MCWLTSQCKQVPTGILYVCQFCSQSLTDTYDHLQAQIHTIQIQIHEIVFCMLMSVEQLPRHVRICRATVHITSAEQEKTCLPLCACSAALDQFLFCVCVCVRV